MIDDVLDVLEEAINRVSDKDWSWWPFLWLRPAKEAPLSMRRLAMVGALYGLPLALASCVLCAALLPRDSAQEAARATLVCVPAMVLLHLACIVAPMWNRRAARLARRQAFVRGQRR